MEVSQRRRVPKLNPITREGSPTLECTAVARLISRRTARPRRIRATNVPSRWSGETPKVLAVWAGQVHKGRALLTRVRPNAAVRIIVNFSWHGSCWFHKREVAQRLFLCLGGASHHPRWQGDLPEMDISDSATNASISEHH
jgi:hypothetical protein